jgi:hypothetical protein
MPWVIKKNLLTLFTDLITNLCTNTILFKDLVTDLCTNITFRINKRIIKNVIYISGNLVKLVGG